MGGMSLGTLRGQNFYAMRANGAELRFPFTPRPFTALVSISSSVGDETLRNYVKSLIDHGCVQAVCRGECERFGELFDAELEHGEYDKNGAMPHSMSMSDEPLVEAISYFVLPADLAYTGLILVIGSHGDFRETVDGFTNVAGELREEYLEPVFDEADLVSFVPAGQL